MKEKQNNKTALCYHVKKKTDRADMLWTNVSADGLY